MSVGEILTAVGSLGTAAAALFAGIQLRIGRKRAQTEFEDSLTETYRGIMRDLPVEAFLRSGLPGKDVKRHMRAFHRYVDLCNEQVFLRQIGRVSPDTWEQWRSGIESNLKKPGFRDAWRYIRKRSDDFEELGKLVDSGFRADPHDWHRRSWLRGIRKSHERSGSDRRTELLNAES